ncbi:fimbria/pilus periplasmic chaperone [Providencia sp.]
MFAKKLSIGALLFALSLTVMKAHAGFGLESTRVIFNADSKTESVVAFNTDKNTNLLVQSWIENENGELTSAFIATPPIFKLRAEQKNTILITQNTTLPSDSDKEALYWLSVKFIAPTDENNENILRYSVSNKIKIIFRPKSLKNVNLNNEVKKLTFSKHQGGILVDNPSKVYINFAEIKLNGHEIIDAPSYISPESKIKIKTNVSMSDKNKVSVKYINDFGTSYDHVFYF